MAGSLANLADSSTARWVGYLSYDLGRLFEALPSLAPIDESSPLFVFADVAKYAGIAHDAGDASRLDESAYLVAHTFEQDSYCDAVARVIDYIRAGDVFQVNLSQRFSYRSALPPSMIYQRLLNQAPSAYGALLDFGDHAVISNSPELFLKVTPERQVITRPIKGTRPRQPGAESELRESVKDQAELNMIVDLERNDLGRVCEIGSVKVSEPRSIETHPTVHHGVATVEGQLRPDVDFVDLLRATFPGGSITGAPKIRAMQIIEELEPVRRGVYCGAIGYLAADGSIELNMAIRTMVLRDGLVHFSVGGGIVADSVPRSEFVETLVKARALQRALGVTHST